MTGATGRLKSSVSRVAGWARIAVHDPGLWRDGLGHLVGVARRGYAGADVEELPDTSLRSQVANHPPEERPVRPHGEGDARSTATHASPLPRCPVPGR
jgi:hypothetical protein